MAKPLKKREPYQRADRAYDYLIANKALVLRYIIAAAGTWALKLLLDWLASAAGLSSLIPFAVRFVLLFILLTFWVYRDRQQEIFRILLRLMLTAMIIPLATLAVNYLNMLIASLVGGGILVYYLCAALLEILYFLIFQFIIFKKN